MSFSLSLGGSKIDATGEDLVAVRAAVDALVEVVREHGFNATGSYTDYTDNGSVSITVEQPVDADPEVPVAQDEPDAVATDEPQAPASE